MSFPAKFDSNSSYFLVGWNQIREGEGKKKRPTGLIFTNFKDRKTKHQSSLIGEKAPKYSAFTEVCSPGSVIYKRPIFLKQQASECITLILNSLCSDLTDPGPLVMASPSKTTHNKDTCSN